MLTIELSKDSFYSNEEIKGILIFEPSQDESSVIFGVVVQLVGTERISWSKAIPLKSKVFYNQTKSIVGAEVSTFPDGTVNLKYPGHQEPINITEKTKFEFTFSVPKDIISSFKLSNACIDYCIKGYIVPIFGSPYSCNKSVILAAQASNEDLESVPLTCEAKGPYYFKHQLDFNVSSDIKISATIDKPVTWLNDEIKVNVALDLKFSNPKTHIKYIRAKLRQVTSFGMVGNLSMHVLSKTLCKITHRDNEGMLRRGHHEIEMTIPIKHSQIQPDILYAKNFKCSHYIMITVPTKMGDQVFVKVPIIIEKLPRLEPINTMKKIQIEKQMSTSSDTNMNFEPQFKSLI